MDPNFTHDGEKECFGSCHYRRFAKPEAISATLAVQEMKSSLNRTKTFQTEVHNFVITKE
jgi:hypothetical protein